LRSLGAELAVSDGEGHGQGGHAESGQRGHVALPRGLEVALALAVVEALGELG
jgi:hypothetical protein